MMMDSNISALPTVPVFALKSTRMELSGRLVHTTTPPTPRPRTTPQHLHLHLFQGSRPLHHRLGDLTGIYEAMPSLDPPTLQPPPANPQAAPAIVTSLAAAGSLPRESRSLIALRLHTPLGGQLLMPCHMVMAMMRSRRSMKTITEVSTIKRTMTPSSTAHPNRLVETPATTALGVPDLDLHLRSASSSNISAPCQQFHQFVVVEVLVPMRYRKNSCRPWRRSGRPPVSRGWSANVCAWH